jgi:hypothetical protein
MKNGLNSQIDSMNQSMVKFAGEISNAFGMIIYPDGRTEFASFDSDEADLEKMQEIVGGLIEIISVGKGKLLICNEEGKINDLPINVYATYMYQKAYSTEDYICGTVLFINQEFVK